MHVAQSMEKIKTFQEVFPKDQQASFHVHFQYTYISFHQFGFTDGFLFITAMSDIEEEYEWVDQQPLHL